MSDYDRFMELKAFNDISRGATEPLSNNWLYQSTFSLMSKQVKRNQQLMEIIYGKQEDSNSELTISSPILLRNLDLTNKL